MSNDQILTKDSPCEDWPHVCCLCEKVIGNEFSNDNYQLDNGVELRATAWYGSKHDMQIEWKGHGYDMVGAICDSCFNKIKPYFKKHAYGG